MGGKKVMFIEPIVSKTYCTQGQTVLTVRRRPQVVNGGGFVVTNCTQKVLFRVDGCGALGTKKELIVRDGDGDSLLLIRQQGGIIQALSMNKTWRGYERNYEKGEKLVFSLKEPRNTTSSLCFVNKNVMTTVKVEPRKCNNNDWDFEIQGSFPNKDCSLLDSNGNIVAQIGVLKEERESKNDVYYVVVKSGFDQAFVVGIVAVLDNINGESSAC